MKNKIIAILILMVFLSQNVVLAKMPELKNPFKKKDNAVEQKTNKDKVTFKNPFKKQPTLTEPEVPVVEVTAFEPQSAEKPVPKKRKIFNKKTKVVEKTPTPQAISTGDLNTFEVGAQLAKEAVQNRKLEKEQGKTDKKETKLTQKEKREAEVVAPVASPIVQGTVEVNRIVSIDDCIKLALANNPSIQSAINNAEIYKTKIGQAWSNYFPTVGGGIAFSRNDMMVTTFTPPSQTYNLYNTPQIQANQLIFDFGKTKAMADMAQRGYESSTNMLQSSVNDVVFATKQSYYNLLYAIEQEKVYAKTVKDYELHLKQAQAYYSIGTKAKIDVTTAEYNLQSAKLNLIKSKNNIKMAFANLNNAIGLPEYANYDVKDKLDGKDYSVEFSNAIQKAYEIRPELLAAKNKMQSSEIMIKASARAFAPDINAFGNYTLGGSTPTKDTSYQIGAQFAYRDTNFMKLKKQMDEAKATYNRDKADFEKTRQDVYLQIQQAYIQYNNARESIPVSKLAMQRAKEQYDLASGRYKVGMGDAIELKDSETTYRNAQLEYYNTLLNYNTTAANLEKSIGAPLTSIANAL